MVTENINIENAEIRFRNFSGKEGKYNNAGNRNFCVLLDNEVAEVLQRDGWNVKYLQPKDPADEPQAYIQVTVSYNNVPPKIWMVTKKKKTLLDEESVNALDYAEIESADVVIRPYNWTVNKKSGVKAYLKTLYVKIAEDEFDNKYSNIPDSAKNAGSYEEDEEVPFE